MITTLKLFCKNCGKVFDRSLSEYNRNIRDRKQVNHFCNLSCNKKYQNKITPLKGSIDGLIPNNRRDRFTPYRWFLARIRYRCNTEKRHKCWGTNIDLKYLKNLWENQKGICPLTGWKLFLPIDTSGWKYKKSIKKSSLDRIDCKKGYVKGNVRFVSVIANIARKATTDNQLIKFCNAVSNFNRGC